jgi:myosin heavy subunit
MEQALGGGSRKGGKAPLGGKDNRQARMREASVSSQFRTSLATLVEMLDSTKPRYVRCVCPNAHKKPDYFHAGDILRQLKCAGMMEAIRIRQQGYALRESHEQMFKRYALLVPGCKNLPVSSSHY